MVQVLLGTLISGRKLFSPNEKSDSDSADPEKGSSSTKENGDTQEGDVATTDADADGTPTTQGGAKHDARKHRDKGAVHRWSPAFAGMCCPFSILLEIPGLTDRWYIRWVPLRSPHSRHPVRFADALTLIAQPGPEVAARSSRHNRTRHCLTPPLPSPFPLSVPRTFLPRP